VKLYFDEDGIETKLVEEGRHDAAEADRQRGLVVDLNTVPALEPDGAVVGVLNLAANVSRGVRRHLAPGGSLVPPLIRGQLVVVVHRDAVGVPARNHHGPAARAVQLLTVVGLTGAPADRLVPVDELGVHDEIGSGQEEPLTLADEGGLVPLVEVLDPNLGLALGLLHRRGLERLLGRIHVDRGSRYRRDEKVELIVAHQELLGRGQVGLVLLVLGRKRLDIQQEVPAIPVHVYDLDALEQLGVDAEPEVLVLPGAPDAGHEGVAPDERPYVGQPLLGPGQPLSVLVDVHQDGRGLAHRDLQLRADLGELPLQRLDVDGVHHALLMLGVLYEHAGLRNYNKVGALGANLSYLL
jgi:hypothetical protein